MPKIDKKYLKGLKFQSSTSKDSKGENGRLVKVFFLVERDMTPDDVLAWKDDGQNVTFVTGDGRKITVAKAADAK